MIAPQAIQSVKDAMRVEEVVGDFVALKRKGPRYLGLCPFHNEKTPSFNVSPNLGIYKCFGCGEAGDAITFLEKHEHLSYVEAIRWLAKRYAIDLPEEEQTPEQQLEHSERESLAVVQQWALNWSVDQLWNTDEGKRIGLSYFHERGFSDATIKAFQLGYVPEQGNAFAYAAQANGFNPEVLEKAGWIKRRDDGSGTPWDFFAGRVTFPILGLSGQPIGFGARTLKSDKKLPKYFNSPESVLYNKSRSLYGIAQAKKSIVEQQLCYLVEGYTDVISLHQAGITNVVASSGTSLTEEQVRLIKRYSPVVTILYDGDAAGMKASLRGIDLVLKEGLNVKVVTFPEGEDPDSFAKSRPSSEVQAHLTGTAQDFLVFKSSLLMAEVGDDPVKKAAAIHEIVESVALVPDQVLRSLYIQQCSRMLGVNEQALISEMNKVLRRQYRKQGSEQAAAEELIAPEIASPQPELHVQVNTREHELMRILLSYGHKRISVPFLNDEGETAEEEMSVAEAMFELMALDDLLLEEPLFNEIYLDYRHARNLGTEIGETFYIGHEREDWRGAAIDLLAEKYTLSHNWQDRHKIHVKRESTDLFKSLISSIDVLKLKRVSTMLENLSERIRDAGDLDMLSLMKEKIHLEQIRLKLAKKHGRLVAV